MKTTRSFSGIPKKYLASLAVMGTGTLVGLTGALPLVLTAIAGGALAAYYSPWGKTKPIEQTLNDAALRLGGWHRIFSVLGIAAFVSVLCIGDPAFALFDGAKSAADSGIGSYIGTNESSSIIDTLIFAIWALGAVGAIGAVAGGVIQNVVILTGSLVLFFGMAILIGVLEFADGLLFS